MKKRKLTSDEILELITAEFSDQLGLMDYGDYEKIARAKHKISFIESIKKKSLINRFFDKYQEEFWFFIILATFALTAKMVIENYVLKHY